MNLEKFSEALLSLGKDIEIRKNEPMAQHTTFQIGGPADVFLLPHTAQAFAESIRMARVCAVPLIRIGRGSNLLVGDQGIRGAVVSTCALNGVRVHGDQVIAEAGATLAQVAQAALRAELSGLEFAAGIPGTVGGGVFMNAGAYGGQMSDVVTRTLYMDRSGHTHLLCGEEHKFGYRTSVFGANEDWTVIGVEMRLQKGEAKQIKEKMDDFAARRREKQPLNYPSAGSTFKRPEGHFAGQLIEQAGMKGAVVGGAQVSAKHAGFIVNCGGATCADVEALIAKVQQAVLQNSGVHLECEVRRLGADAKDREV